jgi:transcriptional regulator with XRE-family HTH domain
MSLKSDGARSLRPRAIEEVLRPRATDLAVRLAEQVRRLRIQAGLTQAELASRAGVTVETVARLERVLRGRLSANANPSLETMERIATALGVEVAELLSAPTKNKPKDDRLASVLRGVSAATRRRVIRVAEALVRDDRVDARPGLRRR